MKALEDRKEQRKDEIAAECIESNIDPACDASEYQHS